MKPIIFVNMPFAGTDRPALGISLLKSILSQHQIHSDIVNFNILFAEMIGTELFTLVSNHTESVLGP